MSMKKWFVGFALVAACSALQAQEVTSPTGMTSPTGLTSTTGLTSPTDWSFQSASDSLHLPLLTSDGRVIPIGRFPSYRYGWGGWNTWDLHQGLNVSIGASVFAQFGKHARHGAGFGQSLSAMYATPITPKLSLAVGGYMNNVYWNHDPLREAGVSAVVSYRFDEHWEAYLYGQKSLVENRYIPWSLYDMGVLGDRIGAAVRYNFNPSFSVEVSVEHGSRPKGDDFERTYMQHAR